MLLIASRRYCDSAHLYRLLLSLSMAILTKSRRAGEGQGDCRQEVGAGQGRASSFCFFFCCWWWWWRDAGSLWLRMTPTQSWAVSAQFCCCCCCCCALVVVVAVSYCGQSSVCACIECGLLLLLRCQIVIVDPDTSSQIGRTICVHWEKSSGCNYIGSYFAQLRPAHPQLLKFVS